MLKIVLDPMLTINQQVGLLTHHRGMMELIYREAKIAVFETEKEIELGLQIVLALLREVYPEYYDLKYFHHRVDMISFRARNKSQIELAKKKDDESYFDFHPKISKNSHRIDKQRMIDEIRVEGLTKA